MTAPHELLVGVAGALVAAGMFGSAAALQHREASAQRDHGPASAAMTTVGLVRRPVWLFAVALAAGSYGVEALALAFGPVALVAPIAATDLLFALPIRARLAGRRMPCRDWGAAAAVALGVGMFLASARPGEGLTSVPPVRWVGAIAAAAAVTLLCLGLAGVRSGPTRARLLAIAAGTLFALLTAVTKSGAEIARTEGFPAVVRHWQPYALIVVGLVGLLTAQAAYRAGPLPASLPIIDILEPVGAVLIGATVLGERLTDSPAALGLQLLGAVVALLGTIALEAARPGA